MAAVALGREREREQRRGEARERGERSRGDPGVAWCQGGASRRPVRQASREEAWRLARACVVSLLYLLAEVGDDWHGQMGRAVLGQAR